VSDPKESLLQLLLSVAQSESVSISSEESRKTAKGMLDQSGMITEMVISNLRGRL
jgi:hypothetical protein